MLSRGSHSTAFYGEALALASNEQPNLNDSEPLSAPVSRISVR